MGCSSNGSTAALLLTCCMRSTRRRAVSMTTRPSACLTRSASTLRSKGFGTCVRTSLPGRPGIRQSTIHLDSTVAADARFTWANGKARTRSRFAVVVPDRELTLLGPADRKRTGHHRRPHRGEQRLGVAMSGGKQPHTGRARSKNHDCTIKRGRQRLCSKKSCAISTCSRPGATAVPPTPTAQRTRDPSARGPNTRLRQHSRR